MVDGVGCSCGEGGLWSLQGQDVTVGGSWHCLGEPRTPRSPVPRAGRDDARWARRRALLLLRGLGVGGGERASPDLGVGLDVLEGVGLDSDEAARFAARVSRPARVAKGGFTVTSTFYFSDYMCQGKCPLFETSTRDDLSSQDMSGN